jgi:hypothetical protein
MEWSQAVGKQGGVGDIRALTTWNKYPGTRGGIKMSLVAVTSMNK